MKIDLSKLINKNEVIAVATSGGSDSMALLHYMQKNQKLYSFKVVALNIEHGIRGEESLRDSKFVADYCKAQNIPLISYQIDSKKFSNEQKLTVEEGARKLRYKCFYDAIEGGKCDKVATAHHLLDNLESVLLNLFRGTGTKGLMGITDNFENKIIRPFINVSKNEIMQYVEKNKIPYVTDSTNLDSDYTRNFLRLNIIPKIKEVFPEAEQSVMRLSDILKEDYAFINEQVEKHVVCEDDKVFILLPASSTIIARATIFAMKSLGVEKDWQKSHIDAVINLSTLQNGAKVCLKKGIIAIKEYDKICFFTQKTEQKLSIPFSFGEFEYLGKTYSIKKVDRPQDIKSGFFADYDKLPKGCVIRTKKDGDIFEKFGGGRKKLNDFFTDNKIPLKDRNKIPVVAKDNVIYFIFKIALSGSIKVDENSKNIVQFK